MYTSTLYGKLLLLTSGYTTVVIANESYYIYELYYTSLSGATCMGREIYWNIQGISLDTDESYYQLNCYFFHYFPLSLKSFHLYVLRSSKQRGLLQVRAPVSCQYSPSRKM